MGLGPCLANLPIYGRQECNKRLGNSTNYRLLSQHRIDTLQRGIRYRFYTFMQHCYYKPRAEIEAGWGPNVIPIS